MTAGNLFCGFVAVIKCIQARLETMAPGTYPHSSAEPIPRRCGSYWSR